MATQNVMLTHLPEILSTIMSEKKRESYELFVDSNPMQIGGFFSSMYRCRYINKDNGEVTYVAIKIVPVDIFKNSYRELHKNEVNFYHIIFPVLDKFQKKKGIRMPFVNVPRYLGGNITEKEKIFIIEDLSAAGYKIHEKRVCLNSIHLRMVFKIYAKLHALSFVYKNEYPQEFRHLTGELVDVMSMEYNRRPAQYLEAAFKSALESFDLVFEADIVAKLKQVKDIKEALRKSRKYDGNYACLTHGDCFLTNILFKYQSSGELEDAKLIDFQLAYVSTPVHDLSYFFYSGAAKVDMDKIDYYLEYYYHHFSLFVRELGADPQVIYPLAVLKEEWKEYSLIGILIGIEMWLGKLMDKDEIMPLIERKNFPLAKYDVWKMSEISFRQRARDICMHAIEYGIL